MGEDPLVEVVAWDKKSADSNGSKPNTSYSVMSKSAPWRTEEQIKPDSGLQDGLSFQLFLFMFAGSFSAEVKRRTNMLQDNRLKKDILTKCYYVNLQHS